MPRKLKKLSSNGGYDSQLKYLLRWVRYVSLFPYTSAEELSEMLDISITSFYRYLKTARSFDVVVKLKKTKNLKGYVILDYGVFDKSRLEQWKINKIINNDSKNFGSVKYAKKNNNK